MDTPTSAASESRQVSPDVSDVSGCSLLVVNFWVAE